MFKLPPVLHWQAEADYYWRSCRQVQEAFWQPHRWQISVLFLLAPGAGRIIAEPHLFKKALRILILSAFFVCAIDSRAALECDQLARSSGQPVTIAKVYDGDTVRLGSGESLRFAGINAPEVRHLNMPAQPFADLARQRLEGLLEQHAPWMLVVSPRRYDRYGRVLGHLISADGLIVERQLLREGLAFLVVKTPAIAHAACFDAVQEDAIGRSLGVWSSRYWQPRNAHSLSFADTGYRRIKGVVTKVDLAGDIFVELDDVLAIRISRKNLAYFPDFNSPQKWSDLLGRSVLVDGWLIERKLSAKQLALGRKALFLEVDTHFSFRLVPKSH